LGVERKRGFNAPSKGKLLLDMKVVWAGRNVSIKRITGSVRL